MYDDHGDLVSSSQWPTLALPANQTAPSHAFTLSGIAAAAGAHYLYAHATTTASLS